MNMFIQLWYDGWLSNFSEFVLSQDKLFFQPMTSSVEACEKKQHHTCELPRIFKLAIILAMTYTYVLIKIDKLSAALLYMIPVYKTVTGHSGLSVFLTHIIN